MKVEVCFAEARGATRIEVDLDAGANVGSAIAASGIVQRLAHDLSLDLSLDLSRLAFAVFGRRATIDAVLQDGDRVELLRPLLVDPKEARRRRAAKRAVRGR